MKNIMQQGLANVVLVSGGMSITRARLESRRDPGGESDGVEEPTPAQRLARARKMNAKLTWRIYTPDGSPAKSPTSKSWARLKYQAHQPDCRSLFALKNHTIKFFGEDIPAFANGDPINDVKAGILSFTTAMRTCAI